MGGEILVERLEQGRWQSETHHQYKSDQKMIMK